MTEIDSNITFENGQITKCVLQIGGKTFTVTLVNSVYNVEDGGTAPCSTPTPGSTAATTSGSTAATTTAPPAPTPGSAPTPTPAPIPSAPLKQEEYDTQDKLIEKLGQYDYKPE